LKDNPKSWRPSTPSSMNWKPSWKPTPSFNWTKSRNNCKNWLRLTQSPLWFNWPWPSALMPLTSPSRN
jgi:hypothetical protein